MFVLMLVAMTMTMTMTAKNRNSEEVARVERSSWNAYRDYLRSVECQVDGERWEKEDENVHIGAVQVQVQAITQVPMTSS